MSDSVLQKIYYDTSNPACFGRAEILYHAAKKILPTIKLSEIKEWLMNQETYSLHKPTRKRFVRNPVLVTGIDVQWELDLVELGKYSKYNNNFKYLLQVSCYKPNKNINIQQNFFRLSILEVDLVLVYH